jgi:hypothetical protein
LVRAELFIEDFLLLLGLELVDKGKLGKFFVKNGFLVHEFIKLFEKKLFLKGFLRF